MFWSKFSSFFRAYQSMCGWVPHVKPHTRLMGMAHMQCGDGARRTKTWAVAGAKNTAYGWVAARSNLGCVDDPTWVASQIPSFMASGSSMNCMRTSRKSCSHSGGGRRSCGAQSRQSFFFPRLLHFPEISLAIDHAAALCAVAPCFDRTIELVRIWNSFLCGQVVHKWAF